MKTIDYYPDSWVLLKIKESKLSSPYYKLLTGWSGGYANGDSWRMNSGVVDVTEDEEGLLHFHGASGSLYVCHRSRNRLSMATAGIYETLTRNQGFEGQVVKVEDIDKAIKEIKNES